MTDQRLTTRLRPATPSMAGTLHLEDQPPHLRLLTDRDDWRTYQLVEPWRYRWVHGGKVRQLLLPAGLVTDLASVPKALHWWIGPADLKQASLPHDLIYQRAGWVGDYYTIDGVPCPTRWTRREADLLFARVMRDSGVSVVRRRWAYRGVRLGGWLVWRRHDQRLTDALAREESE